MSGSRSQSSVLDPIAERLRQGIPLSEALSRESVFSPLLCASVRAVETTGNLLPALERYVEYREASRKAANRVVSALTYPAIVTAVGVVVLLFLLLYLVPRFSEVYGDLRTELPLHSRALFELGGWLSRNAWAALAAVLAGGLLLTGFAVDLSLRQVVLDRFLGSARIQARVLPYELARLYRMLSMLVGSGVSLVGALSLAESAAGSFVKPRIQRVREDLQKGRSITESFSAHSLATPAAAGLLAAAERAGTLGEVFRSIADYYDETVQRRFDRFARFFEPAVLLLVALGVGLVVVLMYMPIFELIGQVS